MNPNINIFQKSTIVKKPKTRENNFRFKLYHQTEVSFFPVRTIGSFATSILSTLQLYLRKSAHGQSPHYSSRCRISTKCGILAKNEHQDLKHVVQDLKLIWTQHKIVLSPSISDPFQFQTLTNLLSVTVSTPAHWQLQLIHTKEPFGLCCRRCIVSSRCQPNPIPTKAFRIYRLQTSRERPKSAPYLRLKNSKRTSKCQSIGEWGTLLWKKNWKKVSKCRNKNWKGPLGFFNIHSVGKYQKIEGGTLWWKFFFEKKSHRAENTQRECWTEINENTVGWRLN